MTVLDEQRTDTPIKWGKVIDNRKCIGCHACSVACKQEHDVPIGVNRTYVKSVEVGTYPNVRRHFQVTRCNQCDDAPCVEICPTSAMYQRPDGIVDFDRSKCIGCQACMAACPYDAIYIDPVSHSAEKCNFCTNRIDKGLQPACVMVCPTQAIFVGDLNDPTSNVSTLIAREKVEVRRPEKNTNPKVFYVNASAATLNPTAAVFNGYFSQAQPLETSVPPGRPVATKADTPSSNHAAAMLAYDNPHKAPWNWIVSAYTWTKSVAAGLLLVGAILGIVGYNLDRDFEIVTTVVAGIFLAITSGLLVLDLHHPKRFLYTLLKPQWRSWVARGSYLITGYGIFLGVFFIALIADLDDAVTILRWPVAILALGAGVYTAFLFGQAKGRDLWQEPGLPLHFLAQVGTAGAAGLVLVLALLGTDAQVWSAASFGPGLPAELSDALRWIFLIAVAANLALMLGHIMMSNASMDRRRALHNLLRGQFSMFYWGGALFGGLVPSVLVIATDMTGAVGAIAAVSALIGLAAYQHAYVQAGQSVPQS